MKYIVITAIMLIFGAMLFQGCNGQESSKQKEAIATEKLMLEANAAIGMPSIVNHQEKRWAKMIFELRDKSDVINYAYIVNMHGVFIYLGRCVGYGLPYSVQYTAPEVSEFHQNGGTVTVPQADPNGLYMPAGLSATWLMMLDEESGEIKPMYVEPEIIVSPIAMHPIKETK